MTTHRLALPLVLAGGLIATGLATAWLAAGTIDAAPVAGTGATEAAGDPGLEALRTLPARVLADLPVPEQATFCGQPVPLERPEVREALAYELVLTVGRPTMPLLWTRRAPAVLPLIESRLREARLPEDLKYVAMIESDLRWTTRSPAGALGLWQFIAGTATRYGLKVDKVLDERMDPERSTDAALRYLRDLKTEFGDWFLAMAAYNSGENTVRGAIKNNGGPAPYFDLYLPYETRRYVYRALAAKLVFQDPEAYGLVRMTPLFVPEFTRVVIEQKEGTIALREVAARHGVGYAALRTANPQLKEAVLPKGQYTLRLPKKGTVVGVEGNP
ncbi:MAG: lytic transglycosylase domain-containing protein [Acidobacteria bacterium]|nr:lytic transglycosylase domain-containing protein [Acidobacteriota bacterium]